MVLKLRWAWKVMFWSFEKDIFQFFASFWATKLKPFSGKVRQNVLNYLNQDLVIFTTLKMVFEQPGTKKRTFWAFEKGIFSDFWKIWVMKFKTFSGKVRESVQNCLNENLALGSFLKNGFKAILNWKTNVVGA